VTTNTVPEIGLRDHGNEVGKLTQFESSSCRALA
jgi:hypothetical protein